MLSYKFKHLVSRVIASLSAFGILSITDHAHAADLLSPDQDYSFRDSGSITFTAFYEGCELSSKNNDASFTNPPRQKSVWLTSSTAATDSRAYCIYICDSSYTRSMTYYSGGAATGAGPHDSIDIHIGATYPNLGQYITGISTQGSATDFETVLNDRGYKAPQDMLNAYAADVNNYTGQHAVVVPLSDIDAGIVNVDNICIQETYLAKFDCGDGEPTKVADSYTGARLVRYKDTIKLPKAENCIAPAGFYFSGWTRL